MRADIEHEVSHDAKNSHFYQVFSTYEDGRRQTRAKRGVCPKYYNIIMCVYIYLYDLYIYIYIYATPGLCIQLGRSTEVLGNVKVQPPLNFYIH